MQEGQIFVPFCYVESAANILTNAALDPMPKYQNLSSVL
ncbi:MAG: hypothetical protein CM15mP63_3020 [Gammaproteobacteria bacterium]|nr:MAG: hypothetical protein CM15mP63_3020 [Gammaproteobacteria bacterium]